MRCDGKIHVHTEYAYKPVYAFVIMSVNVSILYKNQEICVNTQPVKVSAYFIVSLTENTGNKIQIFCINAEVTCMSLEGENSFAKYVD